MAAPEDPAGSVMSYDESGASLGRGGGRVGATGLAQSRTLVPDACRGGGGAGGEAAPPPPPGGRPPPPPHPPTHPCPSWLAGVQRTWRPTPSSSPASTRQRRGRRWRKTSSSAACWARACRSVLGAVSGGVGGGGGQQGGLVQVYVCVGRVGGRAGAAHRSPPPRTLPCAHSPPHRPRYLSWCTTTAARRERC